jgi:hypothetical protein
MYRCSCKFSARHLQFHWRKERIVEPKPLRFVESKVTDDQWFCLLAKPSREKAVSLKLLAISIGPGTPTVPPGCALKMPRVNRRQAAAGASDPIIQAAPGANVYPNNRRLSRAEGRRGCQERNCFSKGFVSFIICSFQLSFNLLQAVTVTPRRRVGRNLQ